MSANRSPRRSTLTAVLVLAGASVLFAGCGDEGAHLPAGMTSSSAALSASGGDVLDSDPGAMNVGLSTSVDDPVLADTSLEIGDGMGDDMWATANEDFANSTAGLSTVGLDDGDFADDGYGYGGGYGYGSGSDWGYGSDLMSAGLSTGVGMASLNGGFDDGGFGGAGLMDAGLMDDGGFDPGFVSEDVGGFDGGIDPGFDAGFDPGPVVDPGGFSGGFDAGPAMDVGGFSGGFDTGGADIGGDQLAVF